MPQSADLNIHLQDQFVDIIELYANYFVKLSAKSHSPKNITVAVFKANLEKLKPVSYTHLTLPTIYSV